MYPGNTHLKPVIGLDIHFVNIPFPCPLPHPYIGLVIDPFDYIPFIGATVKINGVPRGNTDTSGIIITFVHIPFGAGFTLPPIIGHNSQNFFGSKNVQADGAPLSGAGYMLMTCNDIGIPLSLSPGKKFIPIPSLYLPTSFCIPLQWGPPVMVGGPMVPNFSLMALLKGFAFGSFLKVFGKIAGKLLAKLNKAVLKKFPATQKLGNMFCKMGFEPVDLITGRVNYEYTDFEIPGVIPIKWVRTWDSDSGLRGSLGYKTHLCYDRYIQLLPEEDALVVLLADGRALAFPLLQPGENFYHAAEKITLTRKQNGRFLLQAHAENLYYHFNYEPAGTSLYKLSFIEDYSGFRVQLHYSGRHLSALTDTAGRRILCKLNRYGVITSVDIVHKLERKTVVRYSYTEDGDLRMINDAVNQPTEIFYENSLMVKKTDRNGQSFYWKYDDQQRCVHTWGDAGIQEGRIQYFKGYNIVTNGEAEQTTYYYNENNLCVQETDHYGNNRFTEYTETEQLYREIDEEGNVTGYTYNELDQLKEIVNPDGNSTVLNYNEQHQVVMINYPDDTAQTFVYDEAQRLSFINYPNGLYNAYTYDEHGLLSELSSRGGKKIMLEHDEDANLVKMVFDDDSVAQWKYDLYGKCVESIDAEGKIKQFQYDELNRVTALKLPDGNLVKLEYDAYEEVVFATDKQYAVHFEYTPMGSLKKRVQNNTTLEYHYDTQERLTYITNEAGKIYRFGYNKRGEITKEVGFDGLERIYQRDKAGKTIKALRPGGNNTIYEYDANGRIVRADYNDGSWEVYSYDANGRIIAAGNQHSNTIIKRNKLGLVQQENQDGYTVESLYDQFGSRTQIQSNLGAHITVKRNEKGFASAMQVVSKIADSEQLVESVWQAQYKYNKAAQEIEKLLPGGITSEKMYDRAGRPGEHKVSRHNVVQSWNKYTWDTNDRLTDVLDALSNSNTRYRQDAAGNLAWAQYADNSVVIRQADAAGNSYETTEMGDRKFNSAGALLESNKHLFKYDEEGNLISKTDKITRKKITYEWYGNGMLRKVIRPDRKEISFKYDALGRRTEKCFNGTVKRFVWDGNTILHEWTYNENQRPVSVVNEWGDITVDHPEPHPLNDQLEKDNAVTWIFDTASSVPAAKMVGGKAYSIISDYLGTAKEMYDEDGKKVWEAVLDIYGRVRTLTGDRTAVPFRYHGQYEDEETGLYYNRFRYYDADQGNYISQDPIRLEGGDNLYGYVKDSNAYTDFFGLSECVHGRTKKMFNAMTDEEKGRTTFSVAKVKLANGETAFWVAGAGKRGYVPPRIRNAAGTEKVITNKSPLGDQMNRLNDAEQTILREAKVQGATIQEIGATRDMCGACQTAFNNENLIQTVVTPLKP